MPSVRPLRADLRRHLKRHQLERKFTKQLAYFLIDPRYPSLHTELLEPRHRGYYSFRINRSYRAIFIYVTPDEVEIVDINKHYHD